MPELSFFWFFDGMVDQVRDIRIIGLLLEDKIVIRNRAWCLLGRVLRDLLRTFLRIYRQHRFGTLESLAAPSSLAGSGAAALIAE